MREKRGRRRRAPRGDEAAGTMQSTSADDFLGASSSKASSKKSHNKGSPTDVSPDSKCPICLDRFENISHLDRCLHRFCFKCIKEWAKNKAECPLCKQPFHSILHSVRAEDDFKEYVLRPTLNGSFASPDGQRFRYRTTMTRDNPLPMRTLRSSVQRTFSPPDNGVLFEGFTNWQPHQRGSNIQQMMRRLASRRQASAEGRAMRQIQEQELVNFRRALYRSGIRVRSIQDGGRYRDISAEFFRRNPACLHRLVPWLKRELTVLFGTHGSLVNIVQHIIMSNVTRYDMESQAFLEDLRPFLLHRTEHFLHEFINFARCPYNIDAYDQHANYDCPAPSYEEGSESESSVITISPDEINTREPDVPSSSVEVGLAPWDDETPGPSYSTVEQAATSLTTLDSSDEEPLSSIPDSSQVKNDTTDVLQSQSIPSDDCVIVGFVKPLAERTPELVELSSDSEPSLCEVKIEKPNKPQQIPFILSGSSDSHRSSSSSSCLSDKRPQKSKHKRKTSGKQTNSKRKKRKRSTDKSSRRLRDSRKNEGFSYNEGTSRWRERSLSSDCYSRSSLNKAYDSHRKFDGKSKQTSKTREKKHKSWRERRRSRSTDRSWSWRSRTVSLSSESSRELTGSRLRNRKGSRSRSRSRDSCHRDDYQSTYQWEYTYYSRNHHREEFEKSYKKHSRGRGHYSRSPTRQEHYLQSFSLRKDSRKEKAATSDKRRHRSRSHSNSRPNTASTQKTQSDKPSGKRKYKSRHLEPQNRKESSRETEVTKRKEDRLQSGLGVCEDDLSDKSSNEPKQKLRKKTRSPSVEIVYEGKCTQDSKHHKKKKKKHKKKRKHKPSPPIVIRIDSDSDTPVRPDVPCSNNDVLPSKSNSVESNPDLLGESPNTSASVNTIEPDCMGAASPFSKVCDLPSINEHLDTATGILDGLHFGESFDGQAFLPPKTPSPFAEAAAAELPTSDSKSGHNSESCLTPPVTPNSLGILADSSPETFPDPFCEPLEDLPSTSPPVTTASQEHMAENSPDTFADTIEHLEDMIELLSPPIL